MGALRDAHVAAVVGAGIRGPSSPWITRHPRALGVLLSLVGLFEAATVYDFFFRHGTISPKLTSIIFYSTCPAMLSIGVWLLIFGVPRERPTFWSRGMRVVGASGALVSVWLAVQIHSAPKVRVDPRSHPIQEWRVPKAAVAED